jgi:hypothetical protein
MPDLHLPRGQSLAWIVLELVLIGGGVFLGLAGEQWRENAHNRELAETSLRRFRSEIQANRRAVAAVKDYHAVTFKALNAYFAADATVRKTLSVRIQGLQPAFFEHTAWDLALATQSLVHMDEALAFNLSRIYNAQTTYAGLTSGITQAMYLRTPTDSQDAFMAAVMVYYGDLTRMEPNLMEMYDTLLPQLDRALGE